MKYIFKLFDPKTNKNVVLKENYDWDDESLMLYHWLEGNYSCDCNRRLLMYDSIVEFECGEDIKIIEITREDGSKVEFDLVD